jgi:hypothetical protein
MRPVIADMALLRALKKMVEKNGVEIPKHRYIPLRIII